MIKQAKLVVVGSSIGVLLSVVVLDSGIFFVGQKKDYLSPKTVLTKGSAARSSTVPTHLVPPYLSQYKDEIDRLRRLIEEVSRGEGERREILNRVIASLAQGMDITPLQKPQDSSVKEEVDDSTLVRFWIRMQSRPRDIEIAISTLKGALRQSEGLSDGQGEDYANLLMAFFSRVNVEIHKYSATRRRVPTIVGSRESLGLSQATWQSLQKIRTILRLLADDPEFSEYDGTMQEEYNRLLGGYEMVLNTVETVKSPPDQKEAVMQLLSRVKKLQSGFKPLRFDDELLPPDVAKKLALVNEKLTNRNIRELYRFLGKHFPATHADGWDHSKTEEEWEKLVALMKSENVDTPFELVDGLMHDRNEINELLARLPVRALNPKKRDGIYEEIRETAERALTTLDQLWRSIKLIYAKEMFTAMRLQTQL